jgi:hypothetical protein
MLVDAPTQSAFEVVYCRGKLTLEPFVPLIVGLRFGLRFGFSNAALGCFPRYEVHVV